MSSHQLKAAAMAPTLPTCWMGVWVPALIFLGLGQGSSTNLFSGWTSLPICFPTGGRKSVISVLFWCLCQLPKQLREGKTFTCNAEWGKTRWEENALYWDKPPGPETQRRQWVAKSNQEDDRNCWIWSTEGDESESGETQPEVAEVGGAVDGLKKETGKGGWLGKELEEGA